MTVFPRLRNGKVDIKSLDVSKLQQFLMEIGVAPDKALRIYQALWQGNVQSFDEIKTIPKTTRRLLTDTAGIYFLQEI